MYSLCKNNVISKVLNKLHVFHFRSTVHTNTTPTVITHSYVLQKPPSSNAETLKAIVCQTAPLVKLPPGGFLFIHEI